MYPKRTSSFDFCKQFCFLTVFLSAVAIAVKLPADVVIDGTNHGADHEITADQNANDVVIDEAKLTLSGGTLTTNYFDLGNSYGTSYMYMNGGNLTAGSGGNYIHIGTHAVGHVVHSAGTFNVVSSNGLYISDNDNIGWSSYTLTGGELNITNGNGRLVVGQRDRGFFFQRGGIVNANNLFVGFADDSNHTPGIGEYEFSGGTLNAANVYVRSNGSQMTLTDNANLISTGQIHVGSIGNNALSGTGTMTVGTAGETTGPTISANNIAVGQNGAGVLNFHSGAITTTGNFTVGNGGLGTLTVNGGSIDVNQQLVVGNTSSGTLAVNGGTISVIKRFIVGNNANGRVDFSGGTLLLNEEWTLIGAGAPGEFYQTGGTVRLADGVTNSHLVVADSSNAAGSRYEMSGNSLLQVNGLYVGSHGTGTFIQNGGTVSVSNLFLVDNNSGSLTATYELNAGSLNIGGSLYAGNRPGADTEGIMKVNGGKMEVGAAVVVGNDTGSKGTMTVNGVANPGTPGDFDIKTGGDFLVGNHGLGTLTMNSGVVSVGGTLYITAGPTAAGSRVDMTGGALDVGYDVYVGNEGGGTLAMTGGSLKANGNFVVGRQTGSTGVMTVGTGSSVESAGLYVGSYGTGELTIDGGAFTATQRLYIGQHADREGSVNISGGTLTVGREGFPYSAVAVVGEGGDGTLTQTGGTVNMYANTFIASQSTSESRYDLVGGTLNAYESLYVGQGGVGTLHQTGGNVNVTEELYVGGPGGGTGIYDLAGGVLTADNIRVRNTGSQLEMTDGGTLRTASVSGDLRNISGVLDLTYGNVLIDGRYTQEAGGELLLEVFKDGGGMLSADFLTVNGDMLLDGILNILLADTFTTEDVGKSVDILRAWSAFSSDSLLLQCPDLPDNLYWSFDYNPGSHLGTITLGFQEHGDGDVPEPAAWGMLLAGACGVWFLRRKR